MSRVAAAAALWFAMVAFGWEIVVSVADAPRIAGPVFALGAGLWISAALLRADRRSTRRRPAPVRRVTLSQELRGVE